MRALAIGAAGGLLAMAVLTPPTIATLAALAEARKNQAELAAAASAPPASAIVGPGLVTPADTQAAATSALAARIRAAAAKGGVLVESIEGVAGDEALARIRVQLSGSEGAVLGLADALERGAPLVRFARWRVEGRGGSVLLTGELVAPWG